MPSVGAPAAAVGTALGNIPSGMAEGLASGAADYASKIWDASNNVVPTAMQAIGVQPGVPSPSTKADVWAQNVKQFGQDVGQLPDVQGLRQGPGVAGVVGRGLASAGGGGPPAHSAPSCGLTS